MSIDRYRAVALALKDYVNGDVYTLLEAAAAVVALDTPPSPPRPTVKSPDGKATYDWASRLWVFDHEYVVNVVLGDDEVLRNLSDGKRVVAIRRMRTLVPGLGLKGAIDALEDTRVTAAAALCSDPWTSPKIVTDRDEPPF